MFAVVGLGNPGTKYSQTRHNAGAWVLEGISREIERSGMPVGWEQKFNSRYAVCNIEGQRCVLVIPQTYMNESGRAVSGICNFFKIDVSDVIIIHDELDFQAGVVRVKSGGSGGGHKGVADIIRCLGSDKFSRIRIGIGHPNNTQSEQDAIKPPFRGDVSDWVLGKPSMDEQDLLDGAVVDATTLLRVLISEGVEVAQTRFNRRST